MKNFIWLIFFSILLSCSLVEEDEVNDKECSETIEKVVLDKNIKKIGGYYLGEKISFINSDSLEFQLEVTQIDESFDESYCPDVNVLFEYKRIYLEGNNPLLSIGISITKEDLSSRVDILIGQYTFNFRILSEKSQCKLFDKDSLYSRKGFCITDMNSNFGKSITYMDSLKINDIVYYDVFKVMHSVYKSNLDNIYFSIDKGILRFEKENESFIEIHEKKRISKK